MAKKDTDIKESNERNIEVIVASEFMVNGKVFYSGQSAFVNEEEYKYLLENKFIIGG